ncbi:hypothetical protein AHMF7605_27785 [Adhaeribacter arboris]|uniref:Uncharacterized protein n=1 Tax=Adhaeribacter arboris TaxID=2072846 RepID=A0A2T2YND6_9BACT|nr:hypothetical protein [Adhaeribacter arboris]PSR57015.1 hypothetical protein AHMF7605_27785 [Adhaeribacter arboris]
MNKILLKDVNQTLFFCNSTSKQPIKGKRDIAEYIYGEEYAGKNQTFAAELERMEEKYRTFLKKPETLK